MTTPAIWIIFPGFLAILLFLIRQKRRLVQFLGVSITLTLAFLAWRLPIDTAISLSPISNNEIILSSSLAILGRSFILNSSSRLLLVVVYLSSALWFIGSIAVKTERAFIPLGLVISALLTAALSVEPFLYAAVLVEMAALVSVIVLSPPGQAVKQGVLRFITFQTLGMILLLFSGWMLDQMALNPSDQRMEIRAAILLGLGFSMLISAFPFSTWITMVAEESNPLTASFVFFLPPVIITMIGFSFLDRYPIFRSMQQVTTILELLGVVMIFISGVWAAFQRNLGRIFGLAVAMEIGLILVGLSQSISAAMVEPLLNTTLTSGNTQYSFFITQIIPRGLNLAIWALSMAILLSQTNSLKFRDIQGLAHRFPLAVLGFGISSLSLAGFPLFAGFPSRISISQPLAIQSNWLPALIFFGMLGLSIAIIRSLAVLVPSGLPWQITETRLQVTLIILGCLTMLLFGLFPQLFLAGLNQLIGLPPSG